MCNLSYWIFDHDSGKDFFARSESGHGWRAAVLIVLVPISANIYDMAGNTASNKPHNI